MAFLRRKKDDGEGATGQPAPQAQTNPSEETVQAQPAPLESGLERKWEAAWNRARAGRQ
jgi:hypothetical protein